MPRRLSRRPTAGDRIPPVLTTGRAAGPPAPVASRMTRLLALVTGSIAVLVAASCTSPVRHPSGSGDTLAWHPCPEVASALLASPPQGVSYDCASLTVPRDWSDTGDTATFDLALVRVRGSDQHDRIGSLLVNPGGPGASGVDLAVYLSAALPAEVRNSFDIVGFDPRGVGRSDPVDCLDDADLDDAFAADPDPVSQAAFDATVALDRRMADRCQAKYGDELRLFSTVQTAHDLDAIRAAVGDRKLTYLGYSYGTLLGATYAQLFPHHVRAMVLDGAVDPAQDAVAAARAQAAGFERAFDQFAAWCRKTSNCPIHADPRGAVMAALDSARDAPLRAADGRSVTAGWIQTGVGEAMYSPDDWPRLGRAIFDLSAGNASTILQLADEYASRDRDGHYSNMFDANLAINCADERGGATVEQARTLQGKWRQAYPMFGTELAVGLVNCAVWPGKRDPYPVGRADGAPPIVVVGTTHDPATPYEQTTALADMLGVGHVVTWQGQGHTAYPRTSCVDDAVDRYLIDLTVPPAGLTCPPS